MTVKEFIQMCRKEFGEIEYKAVSKDGRIFKTRGWIDYENKKNNTRYR